MARTFIIIDGSGNEISTHKTRRKALCKARKTLAHGAVVERREVQAMNLRPIGMLRQPGTHKLAGRFGMRELRLPDVKARLVREYGNGSIFGRSAA